MCPLQVSEHAVQHQRLQAVLYTSVDALPGLIPGQTSMLCSMKVLLQDAVSSVQKECSTRTRKQYR